MDASAVLNRAHNGWPPPSRSTLDPKSSEESDAPGVRLLAPTAAAGSRVVADIAKVLDGSGGHGESLDAGTEPARPLMGHSCGQRDRASARSPLGGSIGYIPAMLARVTLVTDEAARSRFALWQSGRRSLEAVAEAAWTGSRSALAANLLHDGRRIGRDASR
jgi:hypothetical protein